MCPFSSRRSAEPRSAGADISFAKVRTSIQIAEFKDVVGILVDVAVPRNPGCTRGCNRLAVSVVSSSAQSGTK